MSTRIRIPFWQSQTVATQRRLVEQVLDSNYLNDGEVTLRFEQRLAELLSAKHVVTTTSGTSRLLFVALVAAGVKPGDEVLVPDITFIATANAVTMAGATPVLVDVDPDSLTISPQAAALAVTEAARDRARSPSGRAADMDAILGSAPRHDLAVVEDAAEAFMSRATHKGDFLGTIGDAGCFSFSPNKIITTGQGGASSRTTTSWPWRWRVEERPAHPRHRRRHAAPDRRLQLQVHQPPGRRRARPTRSPRPAPGRMREIYDRYVTGLRDIEDVRLFGFADGERPCGATCWSRNAMCWTVTYSGRGMQGRRLLNPLLESGSLQNASKGINPSPSNSYRTFRQ